MVNHGEGERKMVLKLRLKEVLETRGMTQKDLSDMTGLRPNTISEMVKNTRDTINRENVGIVAKALGISNVSELLYFEV